MEITIPRQLRSTRKAVSGLTACSSAVTLAKTVKRAQSEPLVTQVLVPLRTYSSLAAS